jgi:hypothetical protein
MKLKKTNRFFALLLACLVPSGPVAFGEHYYAVASAGGGGSPQVFAEDFTGTDGDNLDADWAEWRGDYNIFSNNARQVTGSYTPCFAVYTATDTATIDQYAGVTYPNNVGGEFAGVLLRCENTGAPFYALYIDQNANVTWEVYATAAGSGTSVQTGDAGTTTTNDRWQWTIEGTGNSTVVRIWKNPTNMTPVSPSEYDPGDSTPELTFTNDPPTAADVGKKVGICAFSSAGNNIRLDAWRAGDAP